MQGEDIKITTRSICKGLHKHTLKPGRNGLFSWKMKTAKIDSREKIKLTDCESCQRAPMFLKFKPFVVQSNNKIPYHYYIAIVIITQVSDKVSTYGSI